MDEVGERRLAESYPIRRLAQLTIYQWTKLSDWATRSGMEIVPPPVTCGTYTFNNNVIDFGTHLQCLIVHCG